MDIIKQILKDLKVELTDKFDNNFTRGGFFGKKWQNRRDGKATHLNNKGTLRRSIKATISGNTLTFTSSTPYSAIHNEGGEITVTNKMKGYFWKMYYDKCDQLTYSIKKKSVAKTKKNRRLQGESEIYKAMALMKVGSKIKIPQRQFIGEYQGIQTTIERSAKHAIEKELQKIANNIKSK